MNDINRYNIEWDDVSVRNLQKDDISYIHNYYYDSPHSEHIRVDINWQNFPTKEKFLENFEQKLNDPKPRYLVIEYKKQPIGFHVISHIEGTSANLHAHIWDIEFRYKRIALISGFKAIKEYMNRFDLEVISCKPPLDNRMSSNLMAKSGLKNLGEEFYATPILTTPTKVQVFQIHKNDLVEIEKRLKLEFSKD